MAYAALPRTAINNHASNAGYGILDYLTFPLGMLVVAPMTLRTLGIAQYGVWMVATAAVSTGSIIASGFGDANLHFVAISRSSDDSESPAHAVRTTMGFHLALGFAMMLVCLGLAPVAAARIASSDPVLRFDCMWSLFIAGVMMLLRAVETVCVSTQRGFERYGDAVRISLVGRVLTLVAAAVLPLAGLGVISIMVATALVTTAGLWLQVVRLKRLLHVESLWPAFDSKATRALFGFGIFTWIQAVAGLLFGQVDRLVTGVTMGAAAVASYALCVQMAQPIYGIAVSGLHFLFPYLSARRNGNTAASVARTVLFAFCANLLLVSIGTAFLLVFGASLLKAWGGDAVSKAGGPVFPLIIWSTAMAGLSVTGSYALLALGRVRAVTWINLSAGALMVSLIPVLIPRFGLQGMAMARMAYGPLMLLIYFPLAAMLYRDVWPYKDSSASPTLLEKA